MGAFAGKYKKEDFIIAAKKAGFRQQEDLEKFGLIYDYAAANNAPEADALLDKILSLNGQQKKVRTQLAAEMESIFKAAEKWDFVTKCEGWVYSGDKELLETLADARYNKDGSRNFDISTKLYSMMLKDLSDANRRDSKLKELQEKLKEVPEEKRSEAQSKALQLVEKELSRTPLYKECDTFASEAAKQGWPLSKNTLRQLYEAGENLPKENPYVVQLENLRNGRTVDKYKRQKAYDYRQLDRILSKMEESLEKSGEKTPAAGNALREIQETRSGFQEQVKAEDALYDSIYRYHGALGYGGERRDEFRQNADTIRGLKPQPASGSARKITAALTDLTIPEMDTRGWLEGVHKAFQVLDEQLPVLYQEIPVNHPAHAAVSDLMNKINHQGFQRIAKEGFAAHIDDLTPKKFGNVKGKNAYSMFPDELNYVLSSEQEISELAEMFKTRKTGLFTSDTDTYTKASKALDDYVNCINSTKWYLEDQLKEFRAGVITEKVLRERIEVNYKAIKEAQEELEEKMHAYAVHASGGKGDKMGSKKVEDVYRSAGAARYSGAMSVLKHLKNSEAVAEGKVDELSAASVNEVTFKNLYTRYKEPVSDPYSNRLDGGAPTSAEKEAYKRAKENARIRAAKRAQEEMERRIKQQKKGKKNDSPQM